MSNIPLLTTGTSSGMGKYIYERLGGVSLTRKTFCREFQKLEKKGVGTIIHCAFNSKRGINADTIHEYLKDNIFLTKKLVRLPHKFFIFFSSVDVYPKDGKRHSEKELIEIDAIKTLYGVTKLACEAIVKKNCKNFLILRCSGLLGATARCNSLTKILKGYSSLTLSGDSKFNYVLHADVLNFIKKALEHKIMGVYNLASAKNMTLSEIAKLCGKKIKFGKYHYDCGNVDNSKASALDSAFKKTTREVIEEFVK